METDTTGSPREPGIEALLASSLFKQCMERRDRALSVLSQQQHEQEEELGRLANPDKAKPARAGEDARHPVAVPPSMSEVLSRMRHLLLGSSQRGAGGGGGGEVQETKTSAFASRETNGDGAVNKTRQLLQSHIDASRARAADFLQRLHESVLPATQPKPSSPKQHSLTASDPPHPNDRSTTTTRTARPGEATALSSLGDPARDQHEAFASSMALLAPELESRDALPASRAPLPSYALYAVSDNTLAMRKITIANDTMAMEPAWTEVEHLLFQTGSFCCLMGTFFALADGCLYIKDSNHWVSICAVPSSVRWITSTTTALCLLWGDTIRLLSVSALRHIVSKSVEWQQQQLHQEQSFFFPLNSPRKALMDLTLNTPRHPPIDLLEHSLDCGSAVGIDCFCIDRNDIVYAVRENRLVARLLRPAANSAEPFPSRTLSSTSPQTVPPQQHYGSLRAAAAALLGDGTGLGLAGAQSHPESRLLDWFDIGRASGASSLTIVNDLIFCLSIGKIWYRPICPSLIFQMDPSQLSQQLARIATTVWSAACEAPLATAIAGLSPINMAAATTAAATATATATAQAPPPASALLSHLHTLSSTSVTNSNPESSPYSFPAASPSAPVAQKSSTSSIASLPPHATFRRVSEDLRDDLSSLTADSASAELAGFVASGRVGSFASAASAVAAAMAMHAGNMYAGQSQHSTPVAQSPFAAMGALASASGGATAFTPASAVDGETLLERPYSSYNFPSAAQPFASTSPAMSASSYSSSLASAAPSSAHLLFPHSLPPPPAYSSVKSMLLSSAMYFSTKKALWTRSSLSQELDSPHAWVPMLHMEKILCCCFVDGTLVMLTHEGLVASARLDLRSFRLVMSWSTLTAQVDNAIPLNSAATPRIAVAKLSSMTLVSDGPRLVAVFGGRLFYTFVTHVELWGCPVSSAPKSIFALPGINLHISSAGGKITPVWHFLGHADGIVGLASHENVLFGIRKDRELVARQLESARRDESGQDTIHGAAVGPVGTSWRTVGNGSGIRSLAVLKGALYAQTEFYLHRRRCPFDTVLSASGSFKQEWKHVVNSYSVICVTAGPAANMVVTPADVTTSRDTAVTPYEQVPRSRAQSHAADPDDHEETAPPTVSASKSLALKRQTEESHGSQPPSPHAQPVVKREKITAN